MGLRMREAVLGRLPELRYEPTEKRIRVLLGDQVIADTTRAVLVWEPRRLVPSYAVPVDELRATLEPDEQTTQDDGERLLHPGIGFATHSTPGASMTVRSGDVARPSGGFVPDDPELNELVVLDFPAFDWLEEDDRLVSHPRDPFHRVDVRPSSRHVRIELNGEVLAESTRPSLLFETNLPTRFYLPLEDLVAPLRPSDRVTYCAYKGEAGYFSHEDLPHLAWIYRDPLPDAVQIKGMVAFYDDLVDVIVDGVLRERPSTAVARTLIEEIPST